MWPFKEKKYFTKADVDRIAKEAAQAATNESIREVNEFKNQTRLSLNSLFNMARSAEDPYGFRHKDATKDIERWSGYIKQAFDKSIHERVNFHRELIDKTNGYEKQEINKMLNDMVFSPDFILAVIRQINEYQLNGKFKADDENEKR